MKLRKYAIRSLFWSYDIRVTGNFNEISILNQISIVGRLKQVNQGKSISFIYKISFYHSCGIHSVIFLHCLPKLLHLYKPGRVAQSVTCLATDARLTADPGVASSIPAWFHTFVDIDHEIISTVILLLPLIYSRRVVVSYKRKYVHELLVNRLFKPAQEKVWIGH